MGCFIVVNFVRLWGCYLLWLLSSGGVVLTLCCVVCLCCFVGVGCLVFWAVVCCLDVDMVAVDVC